MFSFIHYLFLQAFQFVLGLDFDIIIINNDNVHLYGATSPTLLRALGAIWKILSFLIIFGQYNFHKLCLCVEFMQLCMDYDVCLCSTPVCNFEVYVMHAHWIHLIFKHSGVFFSYSLWIFLSYFSIFLCLLFTSYIPLNVHEMNTMVNINMVCSITHSFKPKLKNLYKISIVYRCVMCSILWLHDMTLLYRWITYKGFSSPWLQFLFEILLFGWIL